MLGYDEALTQVLAQIRPLGTQRIALGESLGRILSEPAVAQITHPPFDGSAMDGYAVKSEDIYAGVTLKQIGESQAGSGFMGDLEHGQCVRIFTGAPMPEGANAVVMQEVIQASGNNITFEKQVEPGQNVRPTGQDFSLGEKLLMPGLFLGGAQIALSAAANIPEVEVFKRPKIGIITTGDELMPPGSKLAPGQIVGSNSFGLTALFAPFTEQVTDLGNVADTKEALEAKFDAAFKGSADIVVSTGGASVGDHDLVLPVLKSMGLNFGFWKIAMRPGKPIIFGKLGDKLFFGLPGNPVSAYVGALTIVLPAIRALSGYADPQPPKLFLPLAVPIPANGPRRHFMRCKFCIVNGQSHVEPILQSDSSHLTSLAQAQGLIVIRENANSMETGDIVEVIPFQH